MKKLNYAFALIILLIVLSCVQEEHQKTIIFSVDMRRVKTPRNVGIRGDFTNQKWRETVAMTDEDGDSIYSVTLSQKTAIYGIEFKFVNQNDQFELQGQDNRKILFEYKPEVIEYIATFNESKDFKINRK